MKDKPNEWVAISDLMSGVMAVVMLFFIVSSIKAAIDKTVMNREISDLKSQIEEQVKTENRLKSLISENMEQLHEFDILDKAAKLSAEQERKLDEMLYELKGTIISKDSRRFLNFDVEESKITLKDGVFSSGSACINRKASNILPELNKAIEVFFVKFPSGRVYIEGHTDNQPVKNPVLDIDKFCTVYDDNYTLSAARAREARKLLLSGSDNDNENRIVVAGFGSSTPIDVLNPSSSKNRRVEVRFILDNVN
ncbi:OmpA family protein [Vibrio sp. 1733]|uniref:OmpA family protein n=1 Tax=Vibrio TaxID=662 RepID=UPI0018E2EB46|nr:MULTISPECIES: OmpA family protein [Vibrio]EHR0553765.1 OmpA family protein [Vibrio parahaemolyticus]EJL6719489.1 OmpA family protein [Vibrio alginolyticus]MBY7696619.1 OmpA family protein [Vibrio alginolyticus]MDA0406370.1 OmpA family protein [Vibrio alginolyticus]MDW2187692.1 OmpA family protein [Vibrio sp. 1733]